MSYALSIDLVKPFDEVVPQVKQALANGFGIVAEIDMRRRCTTRSAWRSRRTSLSAPATRGWPIKPWGWSRRLAPAVQCGDPAHR
jgi:hypothetical protein